MKRHASLTEFILGSLMILAIIVAAFIVAQGAYLEHYA